MYINNDPEFPIVPWPEQSLPGNPLGMVVHRYSKFIPATQAAALQDSLAVFGGHTRTETMHTHTSTYLRLICPLRHYTFLSIKKILDQNTMESDYTACVQAGQLPAKTAFIVEQLLSLVELPHPLMHLAERIIPPERPFPLRWSPPGFHRPPRILSGHAGS